MKKILFPLVVLSFVLLVSSSVFAQEKKTSIEISNSNPVIRSLDSSIFSVERLGLQDLGIELQLQFTISNNSKETAAGTRFIVTGYNKSGQLISRSIMVLPDEIPAKSKLLALIDLNPMMRGAFRYTAEFTSQLQTRGAYE